MAVCIGIGTAMVMYTARGGVQGHGTVHDGLSHGRMC